jgi:RNA polymerase sigma factor (sigma-70 family)
MPSDEILALDDALTRLGEQSARLQTVVEFRYFSGLTDAEIGELLGVSERTVHRDWLKARAWLYKELYPSR